MTNSKNIPKRRFKEFAVDREWLELKLGQLMDVGSVKRVHQSDWREKGIPFLRARDIVAEAKNEKLENPLYIDSELYNSYTALTGKVKKGDILVTGVGTIGVPLLIKNEQPLYFKDGNIIWFKNNNSLDGNFFYYSFISETIQKFISDVAGIGTVGTYTIDSGKKTPIYLPTSKEEQILIGKFFQNIDSLISLHQHKLDKLKNLKKSYLAELFPAEGERVPKRRFPGFEGEWEQRKVSELFKITRGYVLAATKTESNKSKTNPYPVYSSQTKDKGLMGFYGKYLYEDAITWTTDGANAGEVNFREGKFYCTNVCGVLLSKEVQADQMIAEAINSIAKKYVSYVGNPKLMNNVMAEIEVSIPKTSSEREKLSQFFNDIDKQIRLKQQKLDKLKDLKKAYLNELFV